MNYKSLIPRHKCIVFFYFTDAAILYFSFLYKNFIISKKSNIWLKMISNCRFSFSYKAVLECWKCSLLLLSAFHNRVSLQKTVSVYKKRYISK